MGSYTTGNDTYACSSSGCQISCASPEFGQNVCYSMQQNFLDGTSCAGGGKCSNGECTGATVGKEITSWISSNKTIVIAIASVVGGLLVISVLSCCLNRCRRRARMRNAPKGPPPGWPAGGGTWAGAPPPGRVQQPQQPAWDRPIPPPQMRGGNGGWSSHDDMGAWQAPPPAYQGPSVRYA